MFDSPAPRLFNIASGQPFAQSLAQGLIARLDSDDPMALARVTLYAPTRRGVRVLTEAFVDLAGGKPILAPRILTLADLDDPMGLGAGLPEPISGTERLLTLTRLVRALGSHKPHLAQEATATALARDLMSLMDQVHGERLTLASLDTAAPENHAAHWTETVAFLDILRKAWPVHLAEIEKSDPVAHRAELIARQIEAWEAEPPAAPVIVAGSTGSVGISAELIAAVSRLPQGAVVLPGLDKSLDATSFSDLPNAHPDHPQAGLARLLSDIGGADGPVAREQVSDWVKPPEQSRQTFFSIALRPAPVTDSWLKHRREVAETAPEVLANVDLIEAETAQEEAQAIAFAMREAIAVPDQTVALVTTDGTLGRRVSAGLQRWGIQADDSAGRPLHLTPPGIFLSLLLEEGLRGSGPGDPARWLALLKHPLSSLGLKRGEHLGFVRRVEIEAMREASSGTNPAKIRAIIAAKTAERDAREGASEDGKARRAQNDTALFSWLDTLGDALDPLKMLVDREEVPLSEIMVALRASANLLSLTTEETEEVWQEETGKAALSFVEDVIKHAPAFGALAPSGAPALVAGLMADRKVRAPYGQHPRVFIWGTLEARMLSADVMILAGLNEDSWPKLPDPDPWMSRAMRRDFGLPSLERRIGLASHDFQQAFCAKRVILTRARKQDGTPTVASRWLQRITTLLGEDEKTGFAPQVLAEMRERGNRYRGFAGHLARQVDGAPVPRPDPKPPVDARPKAYSVTQIETLARDPYAIYAQKILGLREVSDLSPNPDARDRGTVIHEIVEKVISETKEEWLDDDAARALFEKQMTDALAAFDPWPSVQAFYRARVLRIAPWFLDAENKRRADGDRPVALEAQGTIDITVPGFAQVGLRGYADRIDQLANQTYAIYDYKTGAPPSPAQVAAFAQQLPLEGAMLRDGAFEGVPASTVSKLAHIHLQGRDVGGKETPLSDEDQLIAEAFPKLVELLAAYAVPERGYLSRARPMSITYEGAYDHLARVGEWVSADGGDGE
jgi:ATP-dependent helicase/nuclease subunit B